MTHRSPSFIEPLEPRELLALVPQTITVLVFFDHNSDQHRNHNESGIAGYRVAAKGLHDALGIRRTATATTDAKGIARFTTYVDSTSTNPARTSISLGANDHYNCLNYPTSSKGTVGGVAAPSVEFAMVDYVIFRGTVKNSFNVGDTEYDDGLALRTVFNDANSNGRRDSGEAMTFTDLEGGYQLKLSTGRHTLSALPGADFTAAAGSALTQTFSVNSRPHHDGDPGDFLVEMNNPTVIDVLAAYTPGAADFGPDLDVKNYIADMFATTNDVYANSNTNVQLNLVGPVAVSYTETGDIDKDLTRLATPGDRYLDDLLATRNRLKADLLTLIEGPDYGEVGPSSDDDVIGLGYEYDRGYQNADRLAFAVIRLGDKHDGFTLAHELGHNLGAGHDADHAKDEYLTARYAHGYRFRGNDGEMYQDVMAYGSGTPLPFFSTPLFKFAGKPIGDASTSDNARVIQQIAPDVARYR
jgi:hypothetical protein